MVGVQSLDPALQGLEMKVEKFYTNIVLNLGEWSEWSGGSGSSMDASIQGIAMKVERFCTNIVFSENYIFRRVE